MSDFGTHSFLLKTIFFKHAIFFLIASPREAVLNVIGQKDVGFFDCLCATSYYPSAKEGGEFKLHLMPI